MDSDPRDILLQISGKKNIPGNLREEIKKFVEFAEDRVIKHQAFKLFDLDGDGVVTVSELRNVLTRAGAVQINDSVAKEMVEKADSDGNDVLDYSEFEKLWSQIRSDTEDEKKIREEFLKLDRDQSGFITKDEMFSVVADPYYFSGDYSQVNAAKAALDQMDVDKDGKLSYPEYLLALKFKINK